MWLPTRWLSAGVDGALQSLTTTRANGLAIFVDGSAAILWAGVIRAPFAAEFLVNRKALRVAEVDPALVSIARALTADGVLTPTGLDTWHESTVRRAYTSAARTPQEA